MELEQSEKTRILLAAVHAAATKGFDFLEWFKEKMNLGTLARMSEEDRIKHMLVIGYEKVLLFDVDFMKLVCVRWEKLLRSMVVSPTPFMVLKDYLKIVKVLNE